jgi:hypothetical protein
MKFNPISAIKIFDSIISPILLYNGEVWGVYIKNDFNNWDKLQVEKVHLKFCKLYLGVGRKTSNIVKGYELETYLTTITNSNQRKRLTQLRLSNHKLMIELGRYENIPREDRICKVCQAGEIETEHHFLTSCEAFSSLRESFLNDLESDPTNETDLNEHSLSVEIMKSTHKETVIKLSKFISLCFDKRSKLNALKLGMLTVNRLCN